MIAHCAAADRPKCDKFSVPDTHNQTAINLDRVLTPIDHRAVMTGGAFL